MCQLLRVCSYLLQVESAGPRKRENFPYNYQDGGPKIRLLDNREHNLALGRGEAVILLLFFKRAENATIQKQC